MPVQGIRIEGIPELRAALRAAQDESPKAVGRANKAGAQIVVDRAHPPVLSGRLAASMRATGNQRVGQARVGGARVPYAAAIHWGRKRGNVGRPPGNHPGRNPIAGRPFLTDALSHSVPEVIDAFRQAVDEIVARITSKG